MANYFLRSTDGSDGDGGTTWALAKATLVGALAVATPGDTIFVSSSHAETTAGLTTLTSAGTAASPIRILCVDDTGNPVNPTTLATTGNVATSGTGDISFQGFAYCYGIQFNCGSGSTSAPDFVFQSTLPWWWRFESCKFSINGTSVNARFNIGASSTSIDDQLLEFINTDIQFAVAGQGIIVRAPWIWKGGALTAGVYPTTLILLSSGVVSGAVRISGVDFSGPGATAFTGVDASSVSTLNVAFINCKLGSGFSLTANANSGQGGPVVKLHNCDSADTNYRFQDHSFQGNVYSETTVVRTSGASNGTTPLSWKMISSADSKYYSPLASPGIVKWNDTSGVSKTITLEIVTDNVTLTNAEAWIELEYLGNSSFPRSSFIDDASANVLATPANQTSSSVAWTTTGLTTPIKQKLEVTFTPQEKGVLKVIVYLAKPSTTIYVDPLVTIS